MKTLSLITILSLLIMLSVVPLVPNVKAALEDGTLANALNTIITAHSWMPDSVTTGQGTNYAVIHYATVFSVGNPSYYQTAADLDFATSNNKVQVLHDKRAAEIDGMPTAVSDATVQSYLSSAQMVGYLPITLSPNWFSLMHRFAAAGYRLAPPSLQTKWNTAGALSQINNIVQSGSPGTYIAYGLNSGYPTYYRYYDDTAATIQLLLELGGTSYMSTCDEIWNFQQSYFWNGQYYGYNGQTGMETEVGGFALISGRYLVTKGILNQYGSRIVSDLNQKLLVNGYSSPLWNHYSLNHVPGYDERRLENAAMAWAAIHAFYPLMTSTMQNTLQGMGNIGWRGLLRESGDFHASNNMFSHWAGSTPNMGSTGVGLMLMFMNGIVPKTGSLAMPLNDEWYEDDAFWSPATMFRFDYANRQIRIPVNAGTLDFIFGTGTATGSFPTTGVYQVQFSNDWNTVVSANRIASLDSGFKYIADTGPPPPTGGSILTHSSKDGLPLSGVQIQVSGPSSASNTSVADGTAKIDNLSAGSYTVTATWQSIIRNTPATVTDGETTNIVFDFSETVTTGALTVDALDEQGNPLSIMVTVAGPVTRSHTTPYIFFPLPLGTYTITGISPNGTQRSGTVTLSPSSLTPSYTLNFSGTPSSPLLMLYFVGAVGSVFGLSLIVWKIKAKGKALKIRKKRT